MKIEIDEQDQHSFNPEIRLEGGGSSLTSRDQTQRYPAIRGRVAGPNTYSPVGSKSMRYCANRQRLTEYLSQEMGG